ncbi:MAG TPA: DUF1634 domain-containing protein [Candidatus Baltobacteraceae bacterium]|nr:DUF1634 domain-containing protein [Candidatus Baltobacteraceae bacterium]
MSGPHAVGGLAPVSRMELLISYVLRGGVLMSSAVIAIRILRLALTHNTGYAIILPHHLPDIVAYHQSAGPGAFPTSLVSVWAGAVAGKPYAIIAAGILLLIATPVVRVALSVVFFLAEADWLYVAITLFVLAVLLIGLLTGIG